MADKKGCAVLGAPWSGSGKTTTTLALTAGLKARGHTVQVFKCGPDYIDGTYHAALTGRPVRNLDLWMGGGDDVRQQAARGMQGADMGLVEGVMGLLDSGAPDGVVASTAEVARTLAAPLLLVIDASRMAESVAAIVHGFHTIPGSPGLAGVIVNRVASPGHYALLEHAISGRTGVPLLGYIPERPDLTLPERHLGLVPAIERDALASKMGEWAAATRDTLDWERLRRLMGDARLPRSSPPPAPLSGPPVVVALAQDAAFHFYYAANLELLESYGAEIQPFSPLAGEPIPAEAQLLYAGGGFPEEFLDQLGQQPHAHAAYRRRIEGGLLTLAECGGYMWLAQSLAHVEGEPVPLVGVVPAAMRLERRLQAIGYRTVTARHGGPWPAGTTFRGHEFHHGRVVSAEPHQAAWHSRSRRGEQEEGVVTPNLVAGFTHLYFPSNPAAMGQLLDRARTRERR